MSDTCRACGGTGRRDVAAEAARLAERFWAKVDQSTVDACWPWLAAKDPSGYGRFGIDGRTQLAHRIAYTLTFGAIPDGLVLDHVCAMPTCVNPHHLDPVTNAENVRRGRAGENMRNKTHCPQGHPYSPENTLYAPRPRKGTQARLCRTCRAAQSRKQTEKKSAIRKAIREGRSCPS